MKYKIKITYTNITSEHLCSLSNSIEHIKLNDF